MHPVKSPGQSGSYLNRRADCREALDGKVQQLLEETFRAGWTREEATATLLEIARGHAEILSAQRTLNMRSGNCRT